MFGRDRGFAKENTRLPRGMMEWGHSIKRVGGGGDYNLYCYTGFTTRPELSFAGFNFWMVFALKS